MEPVNFEQIHSTTWIENLAIDEINMEESGMIQFHDHLNMDKMLEESSIEFVEQLKERFEIYSAKFNEYRSEKSKQIKIFKISNTVNDFMLFRNSLKMVVARRTPSIISIGFLSNSGGLYAAKLSFQDDSNEKIHEIKAQVGAFNRINWMFQGRDVDIDSMARHYITEFVKNSAR